MICEIVKNIPIHKKIGKHKNNKTINLINFINNTNKKFFKITLDNNNEQLLLFNKLKYLIHRKELDIKKLYSIQYNIYLEKNIDKTRKINLKIKKNKKTPIKLINFIKKHKGKIIKISCENKTEVENIYNRLRICLLNNVIKIKKMHRIKNNIYFEVWINEYW